MAIEKQNQLKIEQLLQTQYEKQFVYVKKLEMQDEKNQRLHN